MIVIGVHVRHVAPGGHYELGAAIKAGAQVIVTRSASIGGLPPRAFSRSPIREPGSPQDMGDVLSQPERDGLVESAAALRAGLPVGWIWELESFDEGFVPGDEVRAKRRGVGW